MEGKFVDQRIELVDDTAILNEDFKKNVAIPYFKDIYKDLVQQSDNKTKGINKLSILTVSTTDIGGSQKGLNFKSPELREIIGIITTL
jgi:hypothetical protein